MRAVPSFTSAAIRLNGQQGATSYQAKKLQEDEVINKQDAVGKQRPPHVTQRLGLVNACGEETLVSDAAEKQHVSLNIFHVVTQKLN